MTAENERTKIKEVKNEGTTAMTIEDEITTVKEVKKKKQPKPEQVIHELMADNGAYQWACDNSSLKNMQLIMAGYGFDPALAAQQLEYAKKNG